jgi:uncharacterized protein (DUF952 family)
MIYHVTTQAQWASCETESFYAPENFAKIGFVHACSQKQLEGVLQRYFKGQTKLALLEIDENKLGTVVKYEVATGDEAFPHIYGQINKRAIVSVKPITN